MANASQPFGGNDLPPDEHDEASATPDERRPPGRPRTRVREVAAPEAKPEPARIESEDLKSTPEVAKWREGCPKETFEEAWQWILKHGMEMGWEPHQISIRPIRLTNGSASQPEYLDPAIRGDQVLGDPTNGLNAGDALRYWLLDFYHRQPGTPNSYRVRFTGPENEHIVDTKPFRWDSWAQMDARRKAIQDAINSGGSATPSMPGPAGRTPWAPQAPGVPSSLSYDLGYQRAKLEEYERAMRENRAPRPVEQVMSAPMGPSQADIDRRIDLERQLAEANAKAKAADDARIAAEKHAAEKAEMQRQIDKLEAQRKEDQAARDKEEQNARIRALEERLNQPPAAVPASEDERTARVLVAQLTALGVIKLDATGKPIPVSVTPPPMPASASAESLAQAIVDHRTQADKAENVLRQSLGLEPRSNAAEVLAPEPEEKEEPSLLQKFGKTVAENADVIFAGGAVVINAVADNVLKPEVASVVKSAVSEAQQQAARKSVGRAMPSGGGGGRPPSA